MDSEWLIGRLGAGLPHEGELTNVNTLVLRPDCRLTARTTVGTPLALRLLMAATILLAVCWMARWLIVIVSRRNLGTGQLYRQIC
jgi:hypothetical protein